MPDYQCPECGAEWPTGHFLTVLKSVGGCPNCQPERFG